MSLSLPPLRETLSILNGARRKSLGQHFLTDLTITDRIVSVAGLPVGTHVIEIGPGPGSLTRSILMAGFAVTAVEMDPACVMALQSLVTAADGKFTLIQGDGLRWNPCTETPAPRAIIANLPYNVGTAMLVNWLGMIADSHASLFSASPHPSPPPQGGRVFESLTLMFQKEVADRVAALPGDDAYGRLSVLTRWLCNVQHGFDVPPGAFSPPPKVTSSVIRLVPRAAPLFPVEKKSLERVLAAAFNQRRKMLRVSLKSLNVPIETLAEKTGLDLTRRAETLSVQEFCALAAVISAS